MASMFACEQMRRRIVITVRRGDGDGAVSAHPAVDRVVDGARRHLLEVACVATEHGAWSYHAINHKGALSCQSHAYRKSLQ